MITRTISDEVLIPHEQFAPDTNQEALTQRMLPGPNTDRHDRDQAWAEWQARFGMNALVRFVRVHNNTREADDDIIQDALVTAYLGVERGTYQPRDGVPFSAYVVGIARNKIREARRRERHWTDLDDEQEETGLYQSDLHQAGSALPVSEQRQLEHVVERLEQHEQLNSGLKRLPVMRRKVLEHYLSGQSTGEIADSLTMSEALVRQHKCRGLRALQRDLGITQQVGRAV